MASTLDILRAERAAQDAEEARPPFVSVNDVRAFIATGSPAPSDNITLEMCWLGATEFNRGWHVELLNRADEEVFEVVEEGLGNIDPARRSKCIFALTIWKSRDDSLNVLNFRKGFSYRFEKVHSLKLLYGNPVGSMQIRGRLCAERLQVCGPQFEQQPVIRRLTDGGILQETSIHPTATAEQGSARNAGVTPNASGDVAAVVKSPCKRKGRKLDGKVDDAETSAGLQPQGTMKKTRYS